MKRPNTSQKAPSSARGGTKRHRSSMGMATLYLPGPAPTDRVAQAVAIRPEHFPHRQTVVLSECLCLISPQRLPLVYSVPRPSAKI